MSYRSSRGGEPAWWVRSFVGREADHGAGEMRKGIDAWVTRVLDAAHTSVPP